MIKKVAEIFGLEAIESYAIALWLAGVLTVVGSGLFMTAAKVGQEE